MPIPAPSAGLERGFRLYRCAAPGMRTCCKGSHAFAGMTHSADRWRVRMPAAKLNEAEPVLLEARDRGVLRLPLNPPAGRNALSGGVVGGLSEALARAAADSECRVVVIAGAGPAFCAGHDLRELRGDDSREAYERVFAH